MLRAVNGTSTERFEFQDLHFIHTVTMKVAPIPSSIRYDWPFPKLGITMESIQGFINQTGTDAG